MCGRFTLSCTAETIMREFGINRHAAEYTPAYNIAPTQKIVIVRTNGERILVNCRWGFIPSWAKAPDEQSHMINARSETVADKPAFRTSFKNRRCLIIADGFYEWKKGKTKTPVYIRLKSGEPFGFAGIYRVLTNPDKGKICTCAIITTEANEIISDVHDRMPAIIAKEDYDYWLDPASHDTEKLLSLLKPYDPSKMEMYEVSARVNSPSHNTPENILPLK